MSSAKNFYQWHAKQAGIYGWRFLIFQVTVNAVSPSCLAAVAMPAVAPPPRPAASPQPAPALCTDSPQSAGVVCPQAYGVATSFWYFFIPFYLDEQVGLDAVASANIQGPAHTYTHTCARAHTRVRTPTHTALHARAPSLCRHRRA